MTHLPARFERLRLDILVEEGCEALQGIVALPGVRVIEVPAGYQTRRGTRFKARANHYAHQLRIVAGEARDDIWILHLDDDTGVGEDTAEELARFVAQQACSDHPLHLAQGVLSYPREHAVNHRVWLADAVRPGCDVSLFARATGSGTPLAGLHGELLLVRSSVEARIGWDFGPRSTVEDAVFALLFSELFVGRSGWITGCSYGASPVSVSDFLRQRRRWVAGLLELCVTSAVPWRRRLLLAHNVAVWVLSPFQHVVVVLLLGLCLGDVSPSPVSGAVVPFWALNGAFAIWLYWEGYHINRACSADRRTPLREKLGILCLIPLFSLWEGTAIILGAVRFLLRADATFAVIAKPR